MVGYRFSWPDDVQHQSEVGEICDNVVCRTARFIFDEPLTADENTLLDLIDGQWFEVTFEKGKKILTVIPGKWDRN
ncbi:MAG: hypothetical protein O6945_04985 [Gammaproteobacteria bacterium]|nr:hypothetical protein [Gammaproteobacteria bacterium]